MQSRNEPLLHEEPIVDSSEPTIRSSGYSNNGRLSSITNGIQRKHVIYGFIVLALVAFILLIVIVVDTDRKQHDEEHHSRPPIDQIFQCMRDRAPYNPPIIASPRKPDHFTPLIVLQNATIHDGLGAVHVGYDLAIKGGVILAIGVGLSTEGAFVHQLNHSHVTPGLVDMHSHIGVYGWLEDLAANADGNEMTDPITPFVRALDAFDPEDPAIGWTLRGGVTTSNILPGSGNIMGGESIVIKHKPTLIVDEMLVPEAPRGVKMACGENPKTYYGAMGKMPMSRMGSAWLMRQTFERARRMMEDQFAWCSLNDPVEPYPDMLELHSLIALMRHEARLHQHCYKALDFQMILRMAEEFHYHVTAFHHASEAWKVPEILHNITIATWADWNGFKVESSDASVYEPAILEMHHVPVAIHSDDALVARYLAWEAAKAHSYGLSANGSIRAITSVPAAALGLQNRVGSLQPGLDADVVVWNAHPLTLGARPSHVFIEGWLVVGEEHHRPHNETFLQQDLTPRAELDCPLNGPQSTTSCYNIVGVDVYTLAATDAQPIQAATVTVQNGRITCIGTSCAVNSQCTTIELPGGVLVPGFIESGSHLGQSVIDSEAATLDGISTGADSFGFSVVQAADGIHMESRKIDAARHGGVLASISAPLVGEQLIVGFSTAFLTATRTNNESQPLFATDTNIQQRVSVHVSMGNVAKQPGVTGSFSGQVAYLRGILAQAKVAIAAGTAVAETDPLWAFVQVLNGYLPLSIEVNGADEISAIIRLQNQFSPNLRIIIQGGAEAYLVAARLAAATPPISVILTSRQRPSMFETSRAFDGALEILMQAGVPVGLQIADIDNARNLRWEAGWQRVFTEGRLSLTDALKLVTTNIVNIYKITSDIDSGTQARGTASEWANGLGQIRVNNRANFVLFNGNPLDIQSSVQLVALGSDIECRPRHHMPPHHHA